MVSTSSGQPGQHALSLTTALIRSPMLRGATPPGWINNMTDIDANLQDLTQSFVPIKTFAPKRTGTDADLPDTDLTDFPSADLPKFSETDLPSTLIADPLPQFYNTNTTKQSSSSLLPSINEAFLPDNHVSPSDVKADGDKIRTFSVQATSRTWRFLQQIKSQDYADVGTYHPFTTAL